jgi:putative Mg2+ transporter-C (MgtC) family protein
MTALGASIPGESGDSDSRILQGLIAGIGFIGGGAILRDKTGVTGTATVASVWNMGVIGAAVGLGQYPVAVMLTMMHLLPLKWLVPFKNGAGGPAVGDPR